MTNKVKPYGNPLNCKIRGIESDWVADSVVKRINIDYD